MAGQLYGAIEAGGTKFICLVATDPANQVAYARFDTTTPEETLGQVVLFFEQVIRNHGRLAAFGIGSFGPVDLDRDSSTFGSITATPKPHWSHTNFIGPLRQVADIPVGFDTDVNAAALGEHRWGAARGLDTFVYMTIGTGIGGGGMVGGQLLHGLVHPEMGHMRLSRDRSIDPYKGACPFHGDCLEGLASGPAIAARWGASAEQLPDDHPAWQLEADYLAQAMVNLICTLSPKRILLGGGVMQQRRLLPMIRQRTLGLLNGYVRSPAITDDIDSYIVAPQFGAKAGIMGALALAMDAVQSTS